MKKNYKISAGYEIKQIKLRNCIHLLQSRAMLTKEEMKVKFMSQ